MQLPSGMISTADIAKLSMVGIYGHGKNVRKSKGYLRISLIPNVHPTLGTLDNREHGKLRRILNQGLSTANIRGMDAELSRAAELFATRAGENQDRFDKNLVAGNDGWSAPKNMAEWSLYFPIPRVLYL